MTIRKNKKLLLLNSFLQKSCLIFSSIYKYKYVLLKKKCDEYETLIQSIENKTYGSNIVYRYVEKTVLFVYILSNNIIDILEKNIKSNLNNIVIVTISNVKKILLSKYKKIDIVEIDVRQIRKINTSLYEGKIIDELNTIVGQNSCLHVKYNNFSKTTKDVNSNFLHTNVKDISSKKYILCYCLYLYFRDLCLYEYGKNDSAIELINETNKILKNKIRQLKVILNS